MAFQIQGTTIIQDNVNTHLGEGASPSNTNTSIGDFSGGAGGDNTAVGWLALADCTTGASQNVAIGSKALIGANGARTSGDDNVAVGFATAQFVTGGNRNIAIGSAALNNGRFASDCIAIGISALTNSASPNSIVDGRNIAIGSYAMTRSYLSENTIAIGYEAMKNATNNDNSIFIGYQAGLNASPSTGFNTVMGHWAGKDMGSGSGNTFIGKSAGSATTGSQNTHIGMQASTLTSTGSNNTILGYNTKTSSPTASNEIVLGNSSITALRCNQSTILELSDERDKTDIVDLDWSIDFIKDMRPVKFSWSRRDGSMEGKKAIGFIAQELDIVEEKYTSHEHTRLVYKENPDRLEADPMKTYPIVIKALQDIISRIEKIEERLDSL